MNKQITINSIGIIFLIFGIAAIINTILNIDTGIAPVLWMSYICLIIIGIGVLKKDSSLIGITDYLFKSSPIIDKIISLQHIFNLPLSLIALHLIKLKRTDFWIISITQITIVFIISRLTTTYKENVNCVYHNCANFSFGLPYILEWFLAYLIMITLTSYLIKKIFYKKIK